MVLIILTINALTATTVRRKIRKTNLSLLTLLRDVIVREDFAEFVANFTEFVVCIEHTAFVTNCEVFAYIEVYLGVFYV